MSRLLPGRTVWVSLATGLLGGCLVGFAAGEARPQEEPPAAVATVELDRAPLPAGSSVRGREGVEQSARVLAAALDAVPVRAEGDGDDSTRFCAPTRLQVRWEAPLPGEFALGGHIDPVGPAPGGTTEEVNGVVVCEGASYAYMGFEARWEGQAWSLAAVPALSDEHALDEEEQVPGGAQVAPDRVSAAGDGVTGGRTASASAARAAARGFQIPAVAGIDPYASYDPQRICDPVAKPGTVALRDLLLRTYPSTRNLGVSRTCSARGTSEHKEGRAFDWGVDVYVPAERAAAEDAMAQLLATDSAGHRHALARRLGVMYLIWDRKIWSAYSADRGWRPYSGANAHTDHVHLSLSWDGAMGRTSYWQGANATLLKADPDLRLAAPAGGGSSSGSAPQPAKEDEKRASRRVREQRSVPPTQVAPPTAAPVATATAPPRPKESRRKSSESGTATQKGAPAPVEPVRAKAPRPAEPAPTPPTRAPKTRTETSTKTTTKTTTRTGNRPGKAARVTEPSAGTDPVAAAATTAQAAKGGGKGTGKGTGKGRG